MSTKKATKAARKQESKMQLSIASRGSLATKKAPPLTAMMLPISDELLVLRRVHLPTLARQGGPIPQPLTDSVALLFDKGQKAVIEEHGTEKHDRMAAALIRSAAVQVPDSDEIQAALDEAAAILESEDYLDEPLDVQTVAQVQQAADGLIDEAETPELKQALGLVARRARAQMVSGKIAEARRERGQRAMAVIEDALNKLDADALAPLFVPPGTQPDEGQLVLAISPEEAGEHEPDEVMLMHPSDLKAALVHIFTSGPYAHRQFRK